MDGVRREAEGFSEEQEPRINEDVQDVNNGQMGAIQAQDRDQNRSAQLRSRQQPQVQLLRWDRFLPFRSLKVLLVENDDSTRHGVGALLRNCGYEVNDVSDGKQAWKVLEDITIDVDLVLTELVIPNLSGIGLLSKIMSNKTFKDIPVIMMSSHDSRSLVFKCLSKGAVDFMVKPIRKNELKNLWQHVWRKHHTSSGIWIEKPMKSSTVEDSDNTGSNNEGDTESNGLYFRDESDSGTQSSWTRTVDLNSPQAMSPRDQFADPPDSTCAQAIHPRKEAFCINWLPERATRTPVGRDEDLDKNMMGKDLKIGMCGIPSLQLEEPYEKGLSNKVDKSSELNSKKIDKQVKIAELDLNIDEPNAEKTQAVDLMRVSTNYIDPRIESAVLDISNGLTNGTFMKDKAIHDSKEIPFFDVILKRPRDIKDTGTSIHDRNVMRRADLLAFSRYNSASTANEAPTGNVGSCSPLDNSSDAAKAESAPNNQSDSSGTPPSQRSNSSSSSNNNDMESTTNDVFTNQVAYADKPTTKSNVKLQTSPSFQQVQNGHASLQPTIHAAGASQNGSSNALRAPTGGNAGRSTLGSKRRSNGQKRSTTASISRGKKMGSDNRVTGNGGTIDGTGYGNQRGENENHFAQREAALKRFRQKRLERCFEKKVRYESRKKLAEQRPRIRGQFIRKGMQEN